jgi:hypothetical protein
MNIDKLSEAYIQTQIIAYLRKAGVYFRRLNVIAARGHKNPLTVGVPDLMMFYKRNTIFCEIKQIKGEMSDGQIAFQLAADKHGQHYWLIRSVEDLQRRMLNLKEDVK